MPAYRSLGTLKQMLDAATLQWPADFFSLPDPPAFLEKIYVLNWDADFRASVLETRLRLAIQSELSLRLPGLDGVSVVLGAAGDGLSLVSVNFTIGEDSSLELLDFPFLLRFEQQLLKPAPSASEGETSGFVEIGAKGSVVVDSNFDVRLGLGPLCLPPTQIGDSGLVISASDISLDLSRSTALPQVIAAGFDEAFLGVCIGQAAVQFPPGLAVDLPSGLSMRDCVIGTGGFSGSLAATWTPSLRSDGSGFQGEGAGELFGIPYALREVMLRLRQNCFVESRIEGLLLLPFFDSVLCCQLSIGSGGDLALAVAPQQNLPESMPRPKQVESGEFVFNVHDMLDVRIGGIEFRKQGEVVALQLSGGIQPKLGGFDWPEFAIKALTIDSKGRVSVDGGWIDLPTAKTVDLHGFAIEVSKIGFGSEDDGTRWIGFSGGLKLCEGLPMKGAVEGLRLCWKGSDFRLEFKGAEVAFEIPDSISFSGRVEFVDDPDGPKRGFKGGGKLRIIPTGLEIDAQVVIGKNEKAPAYTYFYFFIEAQLPAGIPLFSTGVAIYGLGGLVAYNMTPSKTPEQAWYEDWYKKPAPGVSDAVKWTDERDAFALGAAVTLGTATDDGYAANARTLLVLVMPGPILLIEGKGAVLQKRADLSAEPPFRALAVLDGRAGQFLLNLEARYPSPPEGIASKLIRITGEAEAFFDFHDWRKFHLFLGESDPRSKRIRAAILSLWEANAYLMLFSDRLEVGAWVGYDARWKLGPVRVTLAAWMDGNALVSWKPVQFKGDLTLFGELAIKAFGVGLGMSAGATVEVDAPTPYRVLAELFLKVNLPWPLPDLKPRITLEWKDDVPPPTPIPLATIGVEHLKVSEKWELVRCPRYDTAGDALWHEDAVLAAENVSAIEASSPVVPLDAKIVLTFARSVVDAALVGLNPSGLVAPERVGNYEFRYRLVQIQLDRRSDADSSGTWQTMAIRTVADPEKDRDRLWGSWLAVTGDASSASDSQIAPMTKLLLFAKSPFEYARETIDDTYYDDFTLWEPDYGITRVDPPRQVCVDDFKRVWEEQKGSGTVMSEIRVGDVIVIGENLQVLRERRGTDYVYFLQIGSHTQRATLILFPTKVRKATLHFIRSKDAGVALYDGARRVRSWRRIPDSDGDTKFIDPGGGPDAFDRSLLFDIMVLEGQICISKLCYVTMEEADRFLTEVDTAIHAGGAGEVYSWNEENELFLPGSRYRISIVTEALRRQTGHDEWEEVQTFTETSYFRTADPPGMIEPSPAGQMSPSAEAEHYPERGPLKDLSAYVQRDKLIPPEGESTFYRSYDVGAEFNESYVETMYLLAGKPLVICVYDNNGEEVVGATPTVESATCTWADNGEPSPPRRPDQEWAAATQRAEVRRRETEAVGGQGHSAAHSVVPRIDLGQLPKKKGIWVGGEEFVLSAGTQYRATASAMAPQVIVPLDSEGRPIVRDGKAQYTRVASSGSSFVSSLKDDWGETEPGYKVVSDGRRVVATGYRASKEAQKPSLAANGLAAALKDALGGLELKQKPKTVFSWSFVTSRFATFVHQIHSFVDRAWDLRKTTGVQVWPQEELAELQSLIETADLDPKLLFDKAAACFMVGGRPLPERLEISVLEDGVSRYGLLVESPEPIHWRRGNHGRVSLEISHAAAAGPAMGLAYGPIKLIGCNLASDEWIEVLAQMDLDLSGYKVERVVDEASSEVFYTFPENSRTRAGTQIRIHSGRSPLVGPMDADRKRVYAERATKMLNRNGDALRIVDPRGKEVHRREFAPEISFSTRRTVLASDSDGTRTFVFILRDEGKWNQEREDGQYRLAWTYRRNAGATLPILWRHGSSTSEVAAVEFGTASLLP